MQLKDDFFFVCIALNKLYSDEQLEVFVPNIFFCSINQISFY